MPRRPRADNAVEILKAAADAAYFIDTYCIIDDTQGHGGGGGTMPFKLWPAQVGVVWAFMTSMRLICLKARQLGISWLACGYALWLCIYSPGKQVLIFSKRQDEANEMLRRVKVMFERLPPWMKECLPAVEIDNQTTFGWSNGSVIRSLPATGKAGRSYTASLIVMDEAAWTEQAGHLYTGAKPTIDAGGQLIVISTANGIGNFFHQFWTGAVAGLNGFKEVFLPWWARPGRDKAWYDRTLAESIDPALHAQEYPSTPDEAFVSTGRMRFADAWIKAQVAHALPPLDYVGWPNLPRKVRGLTIYKPHDTKQRCLLVADPAEGLPTGDYSAATLIDDNTGEELASIHGKFEPDDFADLLDALARAYSAQVVVERNNHGHAVLLALKKLGTPKVAFGHDDRKGWVTDAKHKPLGADLLAAALRDGAVKVRTPATLAELQVFSVLENGKLGAPEGYHDDLAMTWIIAQAYRDLMRKRKLKVW